MDFILQTTASFRYVPAYVNEFTGSESGKSYIKRDRSYVMNFSSNILGMDSLYVQVDIDMQSMFANASTFNKDIGYWDVSNVTNMATIVWQAERFNQDLSDWCVSQFYSEPNVFDIGAVIGHYHDPFGELAQVIQIVIMERQEEAPVVEVPVVEVQVVRVQVEEVQVEEVQVEEEAVVVIDGRSSRLYWSMFSNELVGRWIL